MPSPNIDAYLASLGQDLVAEMAQSEGLAREVVRKMSWDSIGELLDTHEAGDLLGPLRRWLRDEGVKCDHIAEVPMRALAYLLHVRASQLAEA